MNMYKLKIPIGNLFQLLNIDNDLYEVIQPADRNINIKTSNGYSPVNAFIKKKGWVRKYQYSGGSITCDEKHLIKQMDGGYKFIKDCSYVLVNNEQRIILSKSNKIYSDVYDIAIDSPHEYITASGVESHNTTCAKIIVNSIKCDYLYINASDENGIDIIRNKIKSFASTMGFNDLKIIILDEGDFCSPNAQAALRNTIETFSKHTRFIFTCNYIERLIDPIKSRLQVFELTAPHKNIVYKHIVKILSTEEVTFDKNDVVSIINAEYPDIRKIIQTCQLYTYGNELKLDKQTLIASNYILQIGEVLKGIKKSQKSSDILRDIRQIIADSKVKRFETLMRYLYDATGEYCSEDQIAPVILTLADSQYQDSFVVDKEINVMSMFTKLIDILKS